MDDQQLRQLETKVNELIRLCETLNDENHALNDREAAWQQERSKLIEKNNMARDKIEAMINRLKSLEHKA
ncbi:Uncharacterised protein [BD1-7 clade bacterium]|uniref:Cell division protein ZapB n=1 Tax=BD1-7 clade bacterium TaxID=2029982 RepID=A0A5S9N5D1_9GAMM|nr:Uncharacterised protein [BD1-7 clade bacterium]CAA0084498.1 Uncharacterised protein [BD1-7 clade bacterium]CAA0115414.1 Uncharacterised protein [BD1-7 clade bacterium]